MACGLVAGPIRAQAVVVIDHVDVLPDHLAEGLTLLRGYADASRGDPGAKRVDVLQQIGRPNHFTIVEEWSGQSAYDAHIALPHTRRFRAGIDPLLGSPFDERVHTLVR
jgi:quinol monooxygenase YgiN